MFKYVQVPFVSNMFYVYNTFVWGYLYHAYLFHGSVDLHELLNLFNLLKVTYSIFVSNKFEIH